MLSDKEKKLIIGLRKNGRQKINLLAKQHNCPTSTMAALLHRLEEKGILEHKSNISFEKLGYPVRMFISVKTSMENRNKLRQYLADSRHVNSLHVVNSGYDYHFESIFRNQKHAQDFLDDLETKNEIFKKEVHYVIDTIHSERFLTEEGHFE